MPFQGDWHYDGPELPLEFARHSGGDRVTLVFVAGARVVPTLWREVDAPDLETAARALAERERIKDMRWIGSWPTLPHRTADEYTAIVREWANLRPIDGVVWTALRPRWSRENGRVPELSEVLQYLKGLSPEALDSAAEYIRKAPGQIETKYRATLNESLKSLGR